MSDRCVYNKCKKMAVNGGLYCEEHNPFNKSRDTKFGGSMNELTIWVIVNADGRYTHQTKSTYTEDLNQAALYGSRSEALAYRTERGEKAKKIILVPKKDKKRK